MAGGNKREIASDSADEYYHTGDTRMKEPENSDTRNVHLLRGYLERSKRTGVWWYGMKNQTSTFWLLS
jgi:hypothetical protein